MLSTKRIKNKISLCIKNAKLFNFYKNIQKGKSTDTEAILVFGVSRGEKEATENEHEVSFGEIGMF